MQLTIQHIELRVTSIEKVRGFYIDVLEFEVLDDMPELDLLALKAGDVRLSIFGGYEKASGDVRRSCGAHLILRTDDLEGTIATLKEKGVQFPYEIVEAGDFMRDIEIADPEGNIIEIAEYLRDPLE